MNTSTDHLPPLPEHNSWEWIQLLASGDERALAVQRQKQRDGIEWMKQRDEEARLNPEPDDGWDILQALNETRLAQGRPPLFEEDEDGHISK